MARALSLLSAAFIFASTAFAGDGPVIKSPSPDGHFALRISGANSDESSERNVELIEKSSGKVVVDLGVAFANHLSDTFLVWSADGKRVAYATRGQKEGDTTVYFKNGTAFDQVDLPDDLPIPNIEYGKGSGSVKNYGGATIPVRWLKSGQLELSTDLTMLSRDNDRTYTGVVHFTIAFDKQNHATVRTVGKTKTTVEK